MIYDFADDIQGFYSLFQDRLVWWLKGFKWQSLYNKMAKTISNLQWRDPSTPTEVKEETGDFDLFCT